MFKQTTLLQNTYVLYAVCLVAIGNLFLFLYAQQYLCIGIFIVSACFTSFFSKYTVVQLVIAMIVCNIVSVCGITQIDGYGRRKGPAGKLKEVIKSVGEMTVNIAAIKDDVRKLANSSASKPITP